jgi:hypothetical protein
MKDLSKKLKTFERLTGIATVTTIYSDGSGEVVVWEDPSRRFNGGQIIFGFETEKDFDAAIKIKQLDLKKGKQ